MYKPEAVKSYYSFVPKPDSEEIPTFSFENERNIKSYRGRIYNKEKMIEYNAKNYLYYIRKFEKIKSPISTPYSVYKKLTKNNSQIFQSDTNNNANYMNRLINNINDYDNFLKKNNKYLEKERYLNIKSLSKSSSMNTIFNTVNKPKEITNPELFYKRNNYDYSKYRAELKKCLDYNYNVLLNINPYHKKKELNINPYNPINADFDYYKSDLAHNPILNPINNYSSNKYLEKELYPFNKFRNNNNFNTNKRYIISTFQQTGNTLINK